MSHDRQGEPRPACPEVWRLDEYAHGRLSAGEQDVLRRHLARCLHCFAHVDDLQAEAEYGRQLRDSHRELAPLVRGRLIATALRRLDREAGPGEDQRREGSDS